MSCVPGSRHSTILLTSGQDGRCHHCAYLKDCSALMGVGKLSSANGLLDVYSIIHRLCKMINFFLKNEPAGVGIVAHQVK